MSNDPNKPSEDQPTPMQIALLSVKHLEGTPLHHPHSHAQLTEACRQTSAFQHTKLSDEIGGNGKIVAISEEPTIDANRAEMIFDGGLSLRNYDLEELHLLHDFAYRTGIECANRIELAKVMAERGTHLIRNQDGTLEEIDGITKQPRTRAESVAVTLLALGKFAEVKFPVKYGSYYSKVVPAMRDERLRAAEARAKSMDVALQRQSEQPE